uniref:TAF6-like RNA polymerase II p300/CBP-associated factor-associated factor 65 kDa subunit 6L n=1 Tax=Hirondellea gigas TaxID=1518452 RepID=A0A6A7FZT7_9CRUS
MSVGGEDRSYAQVAQESITTWAETVGIADLSPEISRVLAADVTYRLRQVLHSASQHLHACKRRRLTTDDVNLALRWMDVPPVLGHSGSLEEVDWHSIPEVGVHVAADPSFNLASNALSWNIYHQPGNPCVKGEWAYISNHVTVKGEGGGEGSLTPLPLSPQLVKYYTTLVSAIFGHSNTIFQKLECDLQSNPSVGPLVGAVVSGCLRGAQLARQNPCILRRVLLVVRAMLSNTHMHVGHAKYVRDIMSLLVFCVVAERKQSFDTHPIRSLATNTMLKVLGEWSEGRVAWDVAVSSLGAVIASTSRPWSQHAGALNALLALGPAAQVSLLPYYTNYYNRLEAALSASCVSSSGSSSGGSPYVTTRDAIDAKAAQGVLMGLLVKIASSYVRNLPDNMELMVYKREGGSVRDKAEVSKTENKESCGSPGFDAPPRLQVDDDQDATFSKLKEVYDMGESWFGSAFVLQVPGVYLCLHKSRMPSFVESHIYKEMQTTGEELLKEMLNKEKNNDTSKTNQTMDNLGGPFTKKCKVRVNSSSSSDINNAAAPPSYDLDFTGMDFESLIGDGPLRPYKKQPDEVFSYYKRILPRHQQVVPMNIHGCSVWDAGSLKRTKSLLPTVLEHVNRPLLVKYYKSKPYINKMPHCKFTRPLHPKIKPGYSLRDIIL